MQKAEKLLPGYFYHIYNRGNNRENIFFEEKNYFYFLELWSKYVFPVAKTFAYVLLKNHFHFLVRIEDFFQTSTQNATQTSEVSETSEVLGAEVSDVSKRISRQFSNMFNAYAKAINKKYDRTGSLFQTRFGRKRVTNEAYLIYLIHYIHFNPQRHGFVTDFRDYPYTSYHAIVSQKRTKVSREDVIDLFGDKEAFVEYHVQEKDYSVIGSLVEDDFY